MFFSWQTATKRRSEVKSSFLSRFSIASRAP
jgi:hypothetical protein